MQNDISIICMLQYTNTPVLRLPRCRNAPEDDEIRELFTTVEPRSIQGIQSMARQAADGVDGGAKGEKMD